MYNSIGIKPIGYLKKECVYIPFFTLFLRIDILISILKNGALVHRFLWRDI